MSHKDTVVACLRCVSKPQRREVRTWGTTTSGLGDLAERLESHACTHVAMEATGVYWKPVWRTLEGRFEPVLANAQHTLRLQKTLEDANIKVASMLCNVIGSSGRAMLAAVIANEESPERLADLAMGTARRKRADLIEALRGRFMPHDREMLKLHIACQRIPVCTRIPGRLADRSA